MGDLQLRKRAMNALDLNRISGVESLLLLKLFRCQPHRYRREAETGQTDNQVPIHMYDRKPRTVKVRDLKSIRQSKRNQEGRKDAAVISAQVAWCPAC